jgi:hypothetical protein
VLSIGINVVQYDMMPECGSLIRDRARVGIGEKILSDTSQIPYLFAQTAKRLFDRFSLALYANPTSTSLLDSTMTYLFARGL